MTHNLWFLNYECIHECFTEKAKLLETDTDMGTLKSAVWISRARTVQRQTPRFGHDFEGGFRVWILDLCPPNSVGNTLLLALSQDIDYIVYDKRYIVQALDGRVSTFFSHFQSRSIIVIYGLRQLERLQSPSDTNLVSGPLTADGHLNTFAWNIFSFG